MEETKLLYVLISAILFTSQVWAMPNQMGMEDVARQIVKDGQSNLERFLKVQDSIKEVEQYKTMLDLQGVGKHQLFVFISFSMPIQSLKQLVMQAARYNGVLVLRGLYRSSMLQTVERLHALRKEGVRAIIHPQLFAEFEVGAVPTFILKGSDTGVIDRISGNVSLEYVLEQFVMQGSNKEVAQHYLRGGQ